MKFVNLLKFNATGTKADALTIGVAVSGFRDMVRAISDGDLAVTDTSMPLTVRDANGNVQTSLYDMGGTALAPTITLKSILTSSLGNKQPVTFSGPLTVFNSDEATYLNGVTVNSLSPATLSDATAASLYSMLTDATGNSFNASLAAMKSFFGTTGAAPADTTPPTFVSAQVANSTPTVVQVTMSETLGSTPPPASALAVSKNGSAVAVSSVTTSGSVMLVTVASAFVNTDANITVTYTKPANGNMLTDAATTPNPAASFGPIAVTNNVAAVAQTDTTKPTVSTTTPAAVANTAPTKVVITMSEALDTTYQPATSTFAVSGHVVSAVLVSGSTITLTTDAFVNGEAARTWTYTPNGTNNIRDLAGNQMDPVATAQPITNNVAAAIVPTLTNASATATSSSAANYSVTTNEANGTLYRLFSTNPTETAATIKAANLTQAVTTAGAQTGTTTTALTASTTYYGHFVYVDGAGATSAVVDTASFTTPAASTMASQYILSATNLAPSSFTSSAMTGTQPNGYAGPGNATRVNIRTSIATASSGSVPNTADLNFVWGKSSTTPPCAFGATSLPAGTNGSTAQSNNSTIAGGTHLGSWAVPTDSYYGTFGMDISLNAYGTTGTYYLWVLFRDGSSKVYDNNGAGPVPFVAT